MRGASDKFRYRTPSWLVARGNDSLPPHNPAGDVPRSRANSSSRRNVPAGLQSRQLQPHPAADLLLSAVVGNAAAHPCKAPEKYRATSYGSYSGREYGSGKTRKPQFAPLRRPPSPAALAAPRTAHCCEWRQRLSNPDRIRRNSGP